MAPEYILNKDVNKVNLFRRLCPHRMYPLADVGTHIEDITCKFHNFKWDKNGNPLNNDKNISCGLSYIGKSGLIFKDFIEPKHFWVDDLNKEAHLEYSHSFQGTSNGSWLWMMEIQVDLLHIHTSNGIHPTLAPTINLDEIKMYEGDGWILQTYSTGWWLVIYPFTFIEWSSGCLSINYTIPNNIKEEFGFSWITQFYYDPSTNNNKRKDFESLEEVFREDVAAIEMQKGKYFPIVKPYNRLENHCVHFGKWILENKLND